jgi:hypothetical protein
MPENTTKIAEVLSAIESRATSHIRKEADNPEVARLRDEWSAFDDRDTLIRLLRTLIPST